MDASQASPKRGRGDGQLPAHVAQFHCNAVLESGAPGAPLQHVPQLHEPSS
jgi:hypothetical protein